MTDFPSQSAFGQQQGGALYKCGFCGHAQPPFVTDVTANPMSLARSQDMATVWQALVCSGCRSVLAASPLP